MLEIKILRLHSVLEALGPVSSISYTGDGTNHSVVISYSTTPTQQQLSDIEAAISSFDWSDEADEVWLEDSNPERKTLREAAQQAIIDIDNFLAIPDANVTQVIVREAVQKLALYMKHVIKRLIQIE
jgi:hypothetical protein